MKRTELAENTLSNSASHSRRSAARAALVACVIAGLPAMGCRSGRSSWNMFSRSEPSAEVLAGSGPTTTYPAPPSTRAQPEAIASIAGGTAADKANDTPGTSGAVGPQANLNPYALAGNRLETPADGVPAGFPTGPVSKDDPHPTVSTSLAAEEGSVPPSYSLPGRTSPRPSSDLAAAANGYNGVPAAVPPTQPKDAGGLPSGYQLGKQPVADSSSALANNSPAAPPTDFGMPPLSEATSPDSIAESSAVAPAKSSGFGLPSDLMLPPAANAAKTTASTAPPATSASDTTAVAALGLPPSQPSPLGKSFAETSPPSGSAQADASTSPAYQTASTSKIPSGSSAHDTNPSGVKTTGYMPGSTGNSPAYPIMR